MLAKRTYAEVVSGDEHTPDDGQSWMRAYQQESEEDASCDHFTRKKNYKKESLLAHD